ncbi:GAF domain-containing protein [Hymenobacter aerilatus]|uniref:GAF domain-containing protein n=1 Tax=Hymenobacter aerilatus TaxID=2932251 RepID=A0A8T9SZ78_9BACT|nr:GAF domain-containing protein [Hymenobacter aerilatus]UOR05540.1 GAF domain-containing protein [Hymenobacter aerilatus]
MPLTSAPQSEQARLQALQPYQQLKATPDAVFDEVAHLMAIQFEVPIVFIALVDAEEIWIKANSGMPRPKRVARQESVCARAILRDDMIIYNDLTREEPELAQLKLVREYQMRFYVAQPLQTEDGHNIGSLCLIGRYERDFSMQEQRCLRLLAQVVMQPLRLRLLLPDAPGSPSAKWADLREQLTQVAMQLEQVVQPIGTEGQRIYVPWERGLVGLQYDTLLESLQRHVQRLTVSNG